MMLARFPSVPSSRPARRREALRWLIALASAVASGAAGCAESPAPGSTTSATGGGAGADGAAGVGGASPDAASDVGASEAGGCYREPDLPERWSPPCEFVPGHNVCEAGRCGLTYGCMVLGAGWCEPGRAASGEDPVQVYMTLAPQVGEREVTRAEWVAAGLTLPAVAGGDAGAGVDAGDVGCAGMDCPVTGVSWVEAVVYANARSDAEGLGQCYQVNGCSGTAGVDLECQFVTAATSPSQRCEGYRLLTAAEWEYAARAGTRTAYWSGPATQAAAATTCEVEPALAGSAWYCASAGGALHPVGQLPANGLGFFDVLGNAAEWVEDELAFDPGAGPLENPGGDVQVDVGAGAPRQIRGGSYADRAGTLRAAARRSAPPAARLPDVGFRVVRWVYWVGGG
ncbi:MAG: SUMF1/EgtB/PvdO family nonheme iron enzyme [Polyangiaceae bacterium]|nr:SUMF1/EgtB/PvdO family nonheme iron enzyme [Polyangiaceae bacterium]